MVPDLWGCYFFIFTRSKRYYNIKYILEFGTLWNVPLHISLDIFFFF